MTLHLGKKLFVPDSRDLRYDDIRLPSVIGWTAPYSWGRGMDFSYWGMMGNGPVDPDDNSLPSEWVAASQGCGDCTCADPSHAEAANAFDSHRPAAVSNAYSTIQQYIILTGQAGAAYDPVSGDNDNGLEIRSVLSYRLKTGWKDANDNIYKIGPYVSVEIGNWLHLQEACYLFSGLSIGMTITQAQMDQFNNGQTWTYVPNSPALGGHDITIVGRPSPGYWTSICWGKRTVLTAQLIQKQVDEIWAYIDPERYSKVTGDTYNGYKDVDLEKYLTLVGTAG